MRRNLLFILIVLYFLFKADLSEGKKFQFTDLIYNYKLSHNFGDLNSIQYLEDVYNYDVLHYEIHFDLTDTLNKIITANIIFTCIPTINNFTEFIFDLDNINSGSLHIDSVFYKGKIYSNYKLNLINEVEWDSSRVRCRLPEALTESDTFKANVYYQGMPFNDFTNWPFGGLAFHKHNGTSIVETMSEPESAHFWLACKDVPNDKAKADIYITTWSLQLAASNGLLQSKTDIPGNKTIHWWKVNNPITTYLIAISVTDYTLLSQSYTSLDGTKTMPVSNYVFPEKEAEAENDFAKVPEMIKQMALKFGEYPFINEKYGNAMVTYPGMEHQTISAMGSDYINGTGSSEDWLVFHELAHHWLGDQVGCATWNDTWLNEGGATFMESLWEEYKDGERAYTSHIMDFRDTALGHPEPLWEYSPPFGIYVYYKGAWVYHMLRYFIGDSLFFGSMKKYLNESPYSYGSATTEQFFDYMQEVSGINLEKFKEQWVLKGGFPEYGFAYKVDNQQDSSVIKIQVKQMQEPGTNNSTFKMPIPVLLNFQDGSDTLITLDDSLQYQVFNFNFEKKIQEIQSLDNFNNKEKILCTKSFIQYNDAEEKLEDDMEQISISPNPCVNDAVINFSNKYPNSFGFVLYNILGEIISEKIPMNYEPGKHGVRMDLRNVASGPHFLTIIGNGKRMNKRVMIVK
ncbi:MAG: hypothetical protein EPN82_16295 [Bacteroidetes bacterium]|nr:MAG: hypothetical protein EPN82_16295 [Bacteroidota bacterium]